MGKRETANKNLKKGRDGTLNKVAGEISGDDTSTFGNGPATLARLRLRVFGSTLGMSCTESVLISSIQCSTDFLAACAIQSRLSVSYCHGSTHLLSISERIYDF